MTACGCRVGGKALAAAAAALAAGVPLLVFPGGDHEAFRPIWQAGRVDFGGRHGFALLAYEAGVPLYPLAVCGSAWTAPVLWRSTWLAVLQGLVDLGHGEAGEG